MVYNLRKRKEPPVASEPVAPKSSVKRTKKEPEKEQPVGPESVTPEPVAPKTTTKRIKKETEKKASKASEPPKAPEPEVPKSSIKRTKKVAEKEPAVASKPVSKKSKKDPEEELEVVPELAEPKPDIKEITKDLKKETNQLVFGSDLGGELGLCKIGCDRKNPTPVGLKERVKQVACGGMHTISLTESGQVYSYGCNDDGALGRITDGEETLEATPTLVDIKDKVTKITAGDSHCAALTDKMEVYIWGNFRDENGMVGMLPDCGGKGTFKPTKVDLAKELKDIASGANHMLLLDVEGVVYSFGVGDHGQLGRLTPEECATKLNAESSQLFLTPKPVDLKNVDPQRPFICDAVFAGEYTSFATNTDKKKNRLAGWGLNNYYQLGYKGQKNQLDQHYPRRCTFTCSTSMINVAGGQHHTIFLTKTGRVYAAGRHEYGMLGIGSCMKDKKEVCPAKQVEGFDSPIKTICAGSRTSFAVSSEGKLYAWGMNNLNLGVEGEDDLMEPTLVKKLDDKKVAAVSSGSISSVVIE